MTFRTLKLSIFKLAVCRYIQGLQQNAKRQESKSEKLYRPSEHAPTFPSFFPSHCMMGFQSPRYFHLTACSWFLSSSVYYHRGRTIFLILTASTNASTFHSTYSFRCFVRYHAPTNQSVAPSLWIPNTHNPQILDSLRRWANAQNVYRRIPLRWPIHIINSSVDKKTYLVILPTDGAPQFLLSKSGRLLTLTVPFFNIYSCFTQIPSLLLQFFSPTMELKWTYIGVAHTFS